MSDINNSIDDSLKSSLSSLSNEGHDNRQIKNKSVQWADWELTDVMDFKSVQNMQPLADFSGFSSKAEENANHSQTPDAATLVKDLIQTSIEIGTIASSERSRSSSSTSCSTIEDSEEKQAALADLITHLEDTAALLRDYLQPAPTSLDDQGSTSQQTTFLLTYQIVLVIFSQFVITLLLTLFDHLTEVSKEQSYHILAVACGSTLQIFNMVLVAFATAVLSKQMLTSKVEGKLMAQTYLATVITFAGLYFIIFRIDPASWEFSINDHIESQVAFSQYVRMLYVSVSAATLCGAANIQPTSWYVILLVCFQSLINFVYFASILAQTIGNYHSYTVQVRRSSSLSRMRASSR